MARQNPTNKAAARLAMKVAKGEIFPGLSAADLEAAKRARETIPGYLASIPAADRKALELYAAAKGFPSPGALAVSLLAGQLRAIRETEQGRKVRRILAGDAVAKRWSERMAELVNRNPDGSAKWLELDERAARLSLHIPHPGNAPGVLVFDLRNRAELADTSGAITTESVAAWLLGLRKPDPSLTEARRGQ